MTFNALCGSWNTTVADMWQDGSIMKLNFYTNTGIVISANKIKFLWPAFVSLFDCFF